MTIGMRFYGLVDHTLEEVVEFFLSCAEAQQALEQVLEDEPAWAEDLTVLALDLGSYVAN